MKFIVCLLFVLWSVPAYAGLLHERVEYNIKVLSRAVQRDDPKLLEVEGLAARLAVKKGWNIHIQCIKRSYCKKISSNIIGETKKTVAKKHTGLSFLDNVLDGANLPKVTFESNAKSNAIKLIGKIL